MPAFVFTAGSLGDILTTAGLASKVVQALYDNRNVAAQCEMLVLELQSLQQVLILTEHAFRKYKSTPLGAPLVHCIQPEVAQCHVLLAQFSDQVQKCQQALSSTTISTLWRRILWTASDEAASLSEKLSKHRLRLALFLITLNSVGFLETDNAHLDKTQGCLPFNCPSSRNRIKDKTIDVVDPLGDTIPISTLFCETWESFHYVVTGYCRDRIGQRYIERGNYQIVQPDNDEVIDRSAFSQTVKEGQIFEMSVILRSKKAVKDGKGRCPRCSYLNTQTQSGSWIRCLRCSGRFYVKEILSTEWSNRQDEDDDDDSNDDDNKGKRQDDITNGMSNELSKRRAPDHSQSHSAEAKFFRRITLEILYADARISASATFTLGGDFESVDVTGCGVSFWIKLFGICLDITYAMRALSSELVTLYNSWEAANVVMRSIDILDNSIIFLHQYLALTKQAGAIRFIGSWKDYYQDGKNWLADAHGWKQTAETWEEQEHAGRQRADTEGMEQVNESEKEGQDMVATGMEEAEV